MQSQIEQIEKQPKEVATAKVPLPRYKMAFVSWVAIYPLVTLIFTVFGPWLAELPLFLRTFALTVVAVPVAVFVEVPFLLKLFKRWL